MQSNDLLMAGGAVALVAAAWVGVGLPLALFVLAVALVYFAHVLPSVELRRSKPEAAPAPEPKPVYEATKIGGQLPVVQVGCAKCKKDYPRGSEHNCEKT